MKILRVITSMNPKIGGPCQGIRNSIPAMKMLGVENDVVCLDNPDEDFLIKEDFSIHAVGAAKGGWGYNIGLHIWLDKHIADYDAIVIHGLWQYHSYATLKAVLKYRKQNNLAEIKVYAMPHGMLDPWFQRDKSRRLKAFRNEIYWRIIEKKVVNSVDGLLFTCEQELLLARETFRGYKPKKEINVGYGIQAPPVFSELMKDQFRKSSVELGDNPYLLFLSRIHQKKGIDLLIDAYVELEKKQFKLPALVIAGPMDGKFAAIVREKAKASEHIHFTGMLQGDAKWGAFYGCDAFILPSHQENFGISVVEALACNKPVLISNQVNIWREILDSGAGIVENDNLVGVTKMIIEWESMANHEKTKMCENAKLAFETKFMVSPAAKKFLEGLNSKNC